MEPNGYPSIFISYSHKDLAWKDRFRKALRGALFEKAVVWCDQDIDGGSDWESRISAELDRADVAFVLASRDYLESEWPRRELKWICRKFQEKHIKHVFWAPLDLCAWKETELAAFQRQQSTQSDKALSEFADGGACDREVLEIVGQICTAVKQIAAAQDPTLTLVKSILGEEGRSRRIRIEKLISVDGDYAYVCRGRDGSQRDVAIKITRRSSIRGIPEDLQKAAQRRMQLRDPGFVRLFDSFLVTSPYGEHLVLITEYFEGVRLRAALNDAALKDRFTTDRAVTLVRRAAEALNELHSVECGDDGVCTEQSDLGFGPMIPEHLFYDQRLDRVRFSALSISNFAWDALGWKTFAMLVDLSSSRYAVPEHISAPQVPGKIDKLKIDQYMLGQLAVEILDGKLPLATQAPEEFIDRKTANFDEPLKHAGPWKNTNPQLERIVAKMLARDQGARFSGMAEIATQLKAVESEQRALAKASYMKWIDTDARFFEEFYERFFARMAAKGVDSQAKFQDRAEQHDKLRKGMAAVLNFYPGNEPTSLRYVIDVHRNRGVTEAELVQFQASFLELLGERLEARMAPDDELAGRKAEICEAWSQLFGQVLNYFREQGVRG